MYRTSNYDTITRDYALTRKAVTRTFLTSYSLLAHDLVTPARIRLLRCLTMLLNKSIVSEEMDEHNDRGSMLRYRIVRVGMDVVKYRYSPRTNSCAFDDVLGVVGD